MEKVLFMMISIIELNQWNKNQPGTQGNMAWPKSSFWFFCTISWRNLNEFFGQPSRSLDILVRETETTPDLLAKLAGGLEDL